MMFKSLILSDLRIELSAKPRPRISPPYAQGLNVVKTLCKGGLTTKTNNQNTFIEDENLSNRNVH